MKQGILQRADDIFSILRIDLKITLRRMVCQLRAKRKKESPITEYASFSLYRFLKTDMVPGPIGM